MGLCLGQRELEMLMKALSHPRLRGLAVRNADIDYPSRTLLTLARATPSLGPLAAVALRRPRALLHLLGAFMGW
jgi:hypothetical protein